MTQKDLEPFCHGSVVLTRRLLGPSRPILVLLASVASLLSSVVNFAHAQDALNGGFERASDVQPERPFAWRVSGSGYRVERTCAMLGETVPLVNGRCSLHLARVGTAGFGGGPSTGILVLRELSATGIAGKRASVTLQVRTTSSDAAQFHAWLSASDARTSYRDSLPLNATSAPSKDGWQQLRAEGAVRKDATRLWIVLQYNGTRESWIDDVQLRAANVGYDSILVALAPNASDESALARYAASLRTSDPAGPDADMARVADMMGGRANRGDWRGNARNARILSVASPPRPLSRRTSRICSAPSKPTWRKRGRSTSTSTPARAIQRAWRWPWASGVGTPRRRWRCSNGCVRSTSPDADSWTCTALTRKRSTAPSIRSPRLFAAWLQRARLGAPIRRHRQHPGACNLSLGSD